MTRSRLLLLVLLTGLLIACAGPTQGTPPPPQARAPQSPEEALRARATQFWDARVKSDLVAQYELLEPRGREQMTLTGFVQSHSSIVFLSYEIQQIEVAGDEGRVTAMTKFRMNLPQVSRFGPWDQRVPMLWRRVDGLWYLGSDQQNIKEPLKAKEGGP